MTKEIIKDIVHSATDVGHHIAEGISHVVQDLTKNINHITGSTADKIANILAEKNISVTRESRHGKECHNIVANSDGTFFTNNSIDFSRSLLNQILFSDGGEERLSSAISGKNVNLKKVQNPKQKIIAKKAIPIFQNNNL